MADTGSNVIIDDAILIPVARQHFPLLDKGIPGRIAELGADNESVKAMCIALQELRFEQTGGPDNPKQSYWGGWLDGFIVGVESARKAMR